MTKANNNVRLIVPIIALAVLLTGIVTAWAVYGEDIKDNAKAIVKIDIEGSKPAVQNKMDIALVKKDITTIQGDIKEMRTEQRAGFKEILKRLPE